MNKTELIDAIALQTGDTKAAATKHLDATLACIVAAVKEGDDVSLIGFGSFKLAKRAARTGKNPATGKVALEFLSLLRVWRRARPVTLSHF